ncbi:hypothetical protein Hanom_Chr07g00652591 [Helianthus anomalus]
MNSCSQPADSPVYLSASPSWFLHVLSASLPLICVILLVFLTVPMMAAIDTSRVAPMMLDHHYNDGLPAGLGVIVRVFLPVSIALEPLWQCCGCGNVDIITGFWGIRRLVRDSLLMGFHRL